MLALAFEDVFRWLALHVKSLPKQVFSHNS